MNPKMPKHLHLSEIPQEGASYLYTNTSGELTKDLEDLVTNKPYEISFFIQPIGQAYELKGSFQFEKDFICSLCAYEFQKKIHGPVHEILIVNSPKFERREKHSKVNHLTEMNDQSPFCTELKSDSLNLGEFFHEILALAEPTRPLGKDDCNETCENYQTALAKGWLSQPNFENKSPFSDLSSLLKKSKGTIKNSNKS